MPYIADTGETNALVQAKKLVGDGQCVALIHAVANIPATLSWRQGEQVKGNPHIMPGTIIATFDNNGRYGNHTNGTSHAAIFLRRTPSGIVVIDRWNAAEPANAHPPQERTIRLNSHFSKKVDQGEKYYVVQ